MPKPKYGLAYEIDIYLIDQSTGQFKYGPTIAAGDFQVSKDNGALTNLTTLPTVSPAAGPIVRVQLSSTEMTANKVTVVAHDAAGDEWNDVLIPIEPETSTDTDAVADGVLDRTNGVYTGVTVRQALRLLAATQGGKTNGGGSTTFNVRDTSDTKNVVTATVDADGNRSAVTLDLT